MRSLAEIEDLLCQAFAEQLALYRQTQEEMDALGKAIRDNADANPQLAELDRLFGLIAASETMVADVKWQWQQGSHKPGPRLQNLITQLGEQLQKLASLVDEVTGDAEGRKAQLLPQFDTLARARQMQKAYGDTRLRE